MSRHDADMSMIKKYRPVFILRLLNWGTALLQLALAVIFLAWFNRLFLRLPLLIIPFSSYVIFIFYSLIRSLQVRLEISDGGILYDSGGYVIRTPWDNVERIGKSVPGLNIPVEGLVLRVPSAIKRSLIASIFWSRGPGYEADYSCSIPLQGVWSWNWRKSELAKDLQHYLPLLF